MVYEWMLILVSPIILLFIIFAYFGVSSLFGKPWDEYDNSNQQKYNSYSRHEWGEQSNADFEERKFWELWQQHWKSKQHRVPKISWPTKVPPYQRRTPIVYP